MDTNDYEERKKLLREIGDRIQTIVSNHSAEPKEVILALALQVGALLSRFESEQRGLLSVEQDVRLQKRLLFGEPTDTERNPGLVHLVASMREQQIANAELLGNLKKTIWKTTGIILGAIGLAVLKVILPHIKL